MSDPAPFLAAIRSAPKDDAPRLVYADWLDEHDQPERAEFIRLQVALARQQTPEKRRREAELLAAHHDAFAGPFAAPGLRFHFERGFIVGFGHTGFYYSDDPGTRTLATTVLAFRPDGRVCVDATTDPAMVFLLRFVLPEDRPADNRRGLYLLDAVAYPAAIRFSWTAPEITLKFRGTFTGAAMDLRCHSPLTRRRFRQRFSHVHIPDRDAGTE